MTSAVQEYKIDKKTPRLKLAARPKPYYQTVGTGKSLGYIRRASGLGSWIVREWVNGLYATRIVGTADDIGLADGRDVLTFDQALRIATAPTLPAPLNSRLTVRAAIDQYIK